MQLAESSLFPTGQNRVLEGLGIRFTKAGVDPVSARGIFDGEERIADHLAAFDGIAVPMAHVRDKCKAFDIFIGILV